MFIHRRHYRGEYHDVMNPQDAGPQKDLELQCLKGSTLISTMGL